MSLDDETKKLCTFEKLKIVSDKGNVEIWSNRLEKPNLPKDELILCLKSTTKVYDKGLKRRESQEGKFAKTGYRLNFSLRLTIESDGYSSHEDKVYYIKGYFYHILKLEGVEIQSFREDDEDEY